MEMNRIYNDDCLIGMKLMDDKSVDLVVTDPPYLFDNGNWHKSQVVGEKAILGRGSIFDTEAEIYTDMSKFSVEDIESVLDVIEAKMKVMNMYLFCSETQVPIYGMWARNKGYHFGILTWEKPLSIINKNRFSTNTEYVCRIYDFGTALNSVSNNQLYNKVIHTAPLSGKDKVHPTQKPIDVIKRFILLSSNEGDVVLDPFMGSGTTAVACIETKRNYIGFEKNNKFFNISERRIKEHKQQFTFDFQ